ncbi:hypothetical protein HK405_012734 [Cladochytrium tenue]|nr:hypothetical protein HK405_012734 [Cladochytrium tenue]
MNELVPRVLASVVDQHGGRYASARRDLAAVALVSRAWAAAALPLLYRRLRLEWYATGAGDISTDEEEEARDDGNSPDSESDSESNDSVYVPREHVFWRYFRPLPNAMIRLIRRDPTDAINPLVFVRDLQLNYIAQEDILYEALEALKRAGSRLEQLELQFVILSEKLLDALEPLVLATTSLTLKHCRMDSNLRDRLLALFSGRLKVFCADWAHDWPLDSDLVSAVVEANTGSLKSFKYYMGKGMLPDITHVASLEILSLNICHAGESPARSLPFAFIGRCLKLVNLYLGIDSTVYSDFPLDAILASTPNLRALRLFDNGRRNDVILPVPDNCPALSSLAVDMPYENAPVRLITRLACSLQALSVYHISSDRNGDGATVLSGALAAGGTSHFPKLRHLEMFRTTAAILDDVVTMCPALQRLDLPATVESLEPLRRLRRLRLVVLRLPLPETADPEACFDCAVELVMPSTAGQKSTIEEVYFVCAWHDSIPSQFARCREIADQALRRTNGIVQLDLPQTMAAPLSAVIEDIHGDWTRQYESQFRS